MSGAERAVGAGEIRRRDEDGREPDDCDHGDEQGAGGIDDDPLPDNRVAQRAELQYAERQGEARRDEGAATASAVTTRRGATTMSTARIAGAATTAHASCSRLVTQRPQRGAVAGPELGEDPLVEDARDERDQHQIERDAELDRE